MKKLRVRRSLVLGCSGGALLALASTVAAQNAAEASHGEIEVTTLVEKVVKVKQENGDEKPALVRVDVGYAGDEIVYTIAFENTSKRSVDNVRITNPIPPRMRYLEGSASGPGTDVLY